MSCPPHLPPRYRFQKRTLQACALNLIPYTPDVSAQHHRFPSRSSIFEEDPLWLDDLSSRPQSTPSGNLLRRSASDPLAILEGSSTCLSPTTSLTAGNAMPNCITETQELADGAETGSGFEAVYVYGPNSPKHKSKLSHSECSIVSTLLKNVPRTLSVFDTGSPDGSTISEPNARIDAHAALGAPDSEKTQRRHFGQRSRVRKLHYIAELEKAVGALENVLAKLEARVNSVTQQRLDIAVENTKLKWKIACLQEEKLIKDVQCQTLNNEMETLKATHGRHHWSRNASGFDLGSMEADSSGTCLQMLDIGKLSLGGNPVPMRHGFGS